MLVFCLPTGTPLTYRLSLPPTATRPDYIALPLQAGELEHRSASAALVPPSPPPQMACWQALVMRSRIDPNCLVLPIVIVDWLVSIHPSHNAVTMTCSRRLGTAFYLEV
jgi:hypothetical protein